MYTYLNLLFKICLFKKGPQDIPHSTLLLQLSLIGFAIAKFLLAQLSIDSFSALLQIGVELIIIIIFARLVLIITHKPQRFLQTMCALIGTDALFSVLAIPIISSLIINNSNGLATLAMLALMLWNWLVTAHIIQHAINKSFSFAAGLVFLYIFSAYQIMGVLFPPINAPA